MPADESSITRHAGAEVGADPSELTELGTPANLLTRPGPVVFYRCPAAGALRKHVIESNLAVAKELAAFMGRPFNGEFNARHTYPGPLYFVPSESLLSADSRRLGIRGDRQLFGGVVPFPFVATKVISHSLATADSAAPIGWSAKFPAHVARVVLPGFSAFTRADASRAGLRLLDAGAVRIKRANGVGGLGQWVARDRRELASALDTVDAGELEREGIVLERNLAEPRTCSVGQVRVDDTTISYCGTQRLTRSNDGQQVYGGSDLRVVRGGWDRLLALEPEPQFRTAIAQARVYHDAAMSIFGMFASRCNYDVAQGLDGTGNWHSGVLEQSWRVGGASAAEVAALHAFRSDCELQVVRASTTEVYGTTPDVPADATVYFQGDDKHAGPITKFARIRLNGHS